MHVVSNSGGHCKVGIVLTGGKVPINSIQVISAKEDGLFKSTFWEWVEESWLKVCHTTEAQYKEKEI